VSKEQALSQEHALPSGNALPSGKALSSVAVYCGSSPGFDPAYAQAAASLGTVLGQRGIRLIYGGGHVGLMGILADAALSAGGEVHGIITRALDAKEIGHRALTSLEVVETMHDRKAAMADKAEGFIMAPGGFGTLDEFFEVVTWTQLGIHVKPCGALDVSGFFAPLRAMIDVMTEAGFVRPDHRDMIVIDPDPATLLDRMAAWEPPTVQKWMNPAQR
jgi:uncharacterized protein (TIGR00730 family)